MVIFLNISKYYGLTRDGIDKKDIKSNPVLIDFRNWKYRLVPMPKSVAVT